MKNKLIVTLSCLLLVFVSAFSIACDLSSSTTPSPTIDTKKQESNTYVTDGWSDLEKYGYDLSDYAEEYEKIIQDISKATTEKQLEEYKSQFDALVKTANTAIEEFIDYKESALAALDESWKNCEHDTKNYEAKYDEIAGEMFDAATKAVIDAKKEEFAALLKQIEDDNAKADPDKELADYKQSALTEISSQWEAVAYPEKTDYQSNYDDIVLSIGNATTKEAVDEAKQSFATLLATVNQAGAAGEEQRELLLYINDTIDQIENTWNSITYDKTQYEPQYQTLISTIRGAQSKQIVDAAKKTFDDLIKDIQDSQAEVPSELDIYKQQMLSQIGNDWTTQTNLYGNLTAYQGQYETILAAIESAATKDLVDVEYQKYQSLTDTIKQTELPFEQYKSQVLQSAETSWDGLSSKTYADNIQADYEKYYTAIANSQNRTELDTAINKFNRFIETAQEFLTYASQAFQNDNATWYTLKLKVGEEFMSAYQTELAADTFDNVKNKQDVDAVVTKRNALYKKIEDAYDAFTAERTTAVTTAQSEWTELTEGYTLDSRFTTSYEGCLTAMGNAKNKTALDAAKQSFAELKTEVSAALSEQATLKQQKDALKKQIDDELSSFPDNVKAFFESRLSQMKKEVENITESIDISNYSQKLNELTNSANTLKEAFDSASGDNLETLCSYCLDYAYYEWNALTDLYEKQITDDLQSEHSRIIDEFKSAMTVTSINAAVTNFSNLKNTVKNNVVITSISLTKNAFVVKTGSSVQDFLDADVLGKSLTVKKSDDSTATVSITSTMFTQDKLDFSKVSVQTLAVTYQNQTVYIVISVAPDMTSATTIGTYEITGYNFKQLGTSLKLYDNGYAGISCKNHSGIALTAETEYFISYEKVEDNLYVLQKDVQLLIKTAKSGDTYTAEYYAPDTASTQYTVLDVYGNVNGEIEVYGEYTTAGKYAAKIQTYSYGQITTYIFLDKENGTVSCSALPEQRLPFENVENTTFNDYVLNGNSITLDVSKIIPTAKKNMEAAWKKLPDDTTSISEVKAVYDNFIEALQSSSSANDVLSICGNFSSFCSSLSFPNLSETTFNGETQLTAYVGDNVNDFLTEKLVGKTVSLKYSVNYTAGTSIPSTLYYTKTVTVTKDMVTVEGMTDEDKFQNAFETFITVSLPNSDSMTGTSSLSLSLTVKFDKTKLLADMQTTWDNLTAQNYKTSLFEQNYQTIKTNIQNADDYMLGMYVSEFNNLVENVKNLTVSYISINNENFPTTVEANSSIATFITEHVLTLKGVVYYEGAYGDGEEFTVTKDMVTYTPNDSTFTENTTYTFTITYENRTATLTVNVSCDVSSIIADFDKQWKQLSSDGYDTAPFDNYYRKNIVSALTNDSSQENVEYIKTQFETLVNEVKTGASSFYAELSGVESNFTVDAGANIEDFIVENILKGYLNVTYYSVYASSPVKVAITRDMISYNNTDSTFTGGNYTFEICYKNTLTGITIWVQVNEAPSN